MANNKLLTAEQEEVEKYFKVIPDRMLHYHEHKEKMTHAGLLVLLAFATAIGGLVEWPPLWVPDLGISKRLIGMMTVLGIWLPINAYIRQQHRMSRMAGRYIDVTLGLLREWAFKKPEPDDLRLHQDEARIHHLTPSGIVDLFLFPIENVQLIASDGVKWYPSIFVDRLLTARIVGRYGSGLLIGVLSTISLVFMLFRAAFGK